MSQPVQDVKHLGPSYDGDKKIADVARAAWDVINKHDAGLLSKTSGDSMAIDRLRDALCNAFLWHGK